MDEFTKDDRIHPKFHSMFEDKGVNCTLDNIQPIDAFERARALSDKMEQLKAELKLTEDEYNATIYEIRQKNLVSSEYYLAEKTEKKVNVDYFKTNLPDYYKQHAHVSHAYAVNIMNKVHGGEQEFQKFLMTTNPSEFEKHATITVSDVTKDFGKEEVSVLKDKGGIEESVKGYIIKPKHYGGIDISQSGSVTNGN